MIDLPPADIKRLAQEARERAEKASKGKWTVAGSTLPGIMLNGPAGNVEARADHWSDELAAQTVTDLEFVAHARTDIPALADAVLALLAEREALMRVAEAAANYRQRQAHATLHPNSNSFNREIKAGRTLDHSLAALPTHLRAEIKDKEG